MMLLVENFVCKVDRERRRRSMIKKGKNLMVLTALILLSVLILRWRVYAESEKQDAGNEIIAFRCV